MSPLLRGNYKIVSNLNISFGLMKCLFIYMYIHKSIYFYKSLCVYGLENQLGKMINVFGTYTHDASTIKI